MSEGSVSLNGSSRCDDRSDETFSLDKLAEAAVVEGIGHIEAISEIFDMYCLNIGVIIRSSSSLDFGQCRGQFFTYRRVILRW